MAKLMLSWNQHLGRVQLQLIGLDWIPKAYQGTIRDSPPSLKWQPLPLKYKTNMTHFPYYVLSLYHHCNYHIFHSLTVLIVVSLIFRCFSLLGMHSVMALQGNPWMRKIRVELFIYFFFPTYIGGPFIKSCSNKLLPFSPRSLHLPMNRGSPELSPWPVLPGKISPRGK